MLFDGKHDRLITGINIILCGRDCIHGDGGPHVGEVARLRGV